MLKCFVKIISCNSDCHISQLTDPVTAKFRMGELEPWMDESSIRNTWYSMGEQVNVKMIRDKFSG